MRGRFHPGPAPSTDGPVIVSLTEFTAHQLATLPGIVRAGLALQRGWWAMPGAIGVLLYLEPGRRRGGSLSVWQTEADLRRFVGLPRHAAIMRAHRERVTVRATTWTTERFRVADAWAAGQARLSPLSGTSQARSSP